MQILLTKIFSGFGFSKKDAAEGSFFFASGTAEKTEYYLVYFTTRDLLIGYASQPSFAAALDFLDRESQEQGDISKNTSILICVLMDNLHADCTKYKYDIQKIEEEEIQYKHYVLPYVDTPVSHLNSLTDPVEELNIILNQESRFSEYFTSPYANALYFLVMQLFLKLPFMGPIPQSMTNFTTIESLVEQYIDFSRAKTFYELAISDEINDINWELARDQALDSTTKEFEKTMIKFKQNEDY